MIAGASMLVRSMRAAPRQLRSFASTNKNIADIRKKYYENATQPTYLKEPGDQMVFYAAVGGAFVGIATVFYGLFSMSFGINKVQR